MTTPPITVLHYTSNREDEFFASQIRQKIMESKGDLPLISVSQKPMDFGENICVGIHDSCYGNLWRQFQIGLKAAKTPFVLLAEADFLYPPEYFQFVPPKKHNYRYNNVWILYDKNPPSRYHFKGTSDGAELIYRDSFLEVIDKALEGKKEWFSKEDEFIVPFKKTVDEYTWGGNPAISFKTKNQVKSNTQTKGISPRYNLPYWGNADELKRKYLGVREPTTQNAMLGKWDNWYKKIGEGAKPLRYGEDDITYKLAGDFLKDVDSVEDWGCGMGAFRNFYTGRYVGVDGTKNPFVDKVVDLREYTSDVDGIMMRHVLEHNYDWEKVLSNAVSSFRKKFCLILFTPFQDKTGVIAQNKRYGVDVPDIAFKRGDIESKLKGLKWRTETHRTRTQYRNEHIYFIEREPK